MTTRMERTMTDQRGETATPRPALDVDAIMRLLPHRPPFLLVDRIVEWTPGRSCVGIKCVTMNEPFFAGHFPGRPVMPGVLIIEALAQVGAVLLFASLSEAERPRKLVFFGGADKARFRVPVVPGDVLRLEIEVLKIRGPVSRVQGRAHVEGRLVAEAEITSMMVDA
jgi:beta-hydroxyacyl-ACP dehydratase FabZ